MLDQEEQVFVQDNIFLQEEVMEVVQGLQHSLALPKDSWTQQHTAGVSSPSLWLQPAESWEEGPGYMSRSIGALIATKTEALGSLSGHCQEQRVRNLETFAIFDCFWNLLFVAVVLQ